MIDTHCHILPCLDDGSKSMKESVKIAKKAVKEGVEVIIATPHQGNGVYLFSFDEISKSCAALNEELRKQRVDVEVLIGAENRLTPDLMSGSNGLITLGKSGKAALIELPPTFLPESVLHAVKDIACSGLVPVIAHPERNGVLLKRVELIRELVINGALMQVTAGSLAGDFGPVSRRCVEWMLDNELVHMVGSDYHPRRKYRMADCRKRLTKRVGHKKADEIVFQSAAELLLERQECQNYQ